MGKRRKLSYHLPLLAALLLAPLLPFLLAPAGRVMGNPACDNPAAFYYFNAFAGRCWRAGTLPLWNPHIMLGMPFLGEGQAAIFHPLSWLFALLPTGTAINWLIALGVLAGGLFFYGYLRALRLSREGALCGALVWGFSSALVTRIHAGHLNVLLTLIEPPLLLLLWERWRAGGGKGGGWLIGIALGYGAMILAAHPQVLYLFSLFFGWYVLTNQCGMRNAECGIKAMRNAECGMRNEKYLNSAFRIPHSALNPLLLLAGFVLLGIGIGAVQLLPMADFAGESFRLATSTVFSGEYSFNPENFWLMLVPRCFGLATDPGAGHYWANHNYWEMLIYFGILPLVLVPAGIMAAPGRRRLALGGGAVIFTLLALGEYTPLWPLFYHGVPLLKLFRVPARAMLVTQFCLVTLAAYGIEGLLHPGPKARRRARVAGITAGALAAVLAAAYLYFCLPCPEAAGSHWRGLVGWLCRPAAGGAMRAADFTPELLARTVGEAGREILRALGLVALAGGVIALAVRAHGKRQNAGGAGRAKKDNAREGACRFHRKRPTLVLALTITLILADLAGVYLPLLVSYDEAIAGCPEERVAPLRGFPYPARVLDPVATENITMLTGLSSPAGYAGNTLARYSRFVNLVQGIAPETAQTHNQLKTYAPLIRYMAPDAVFVPERGVRPDMTVLARQPGVWALVKYPEALPRAYLAEAPRGAASEAEATRLTLAAGAELRRAPVIERVEGGARSAEIVVGNGALELEEGVRFISFEPNRVELETWAARPRTLVLCEMYEKSWTARVNGEARTVYPANVLFRAVAVPAGRARVVFEYRPAALRWGAGITLAALGALAAGAGWLAWRGWKTHRQKIRL